MAGRRAQAIKSMGAPQSADDLVSLFTTLPDPRSERNQDYPLEEVLFLVLAGVLSGFNHMTHIAQFGQDKLDWFRTVLPYQNGVPSHDTIGRVLGMLCPDALELMFERWMQRVARTEGVVAIDGKTVRGAVARGNDRAFVHMVSAFGSANGMVLGQLRTAEKSNEITAIPRLIESLKLDGAVVTIDAGGCHKKIVEAIDEANADFVIGVKANQPTLLEDMSVAFHDVDNGVIDSEKWESEEVAHGRGEMRSCQVLEAQGRLSDTEKWSKINSLIRIVSERFVGGRPTQNIRFYISSLKALEPQRALELVRAHWSIENRLHWCLDVQFDEDKCRVYADNAAENLVVTRHIALNLLRQATFLPGGIMGRRMQCCSSDPKRERVLAGILN